MTSARKIWVDSVRGFCMLAIVLNHTDIYLAGEEPILSFDLFGTDALMTFFVVSGYLFYRENFDIRRKLSSEFRHLVVPYFIFTLLIAVPKVLVRGETISPSEILLGIVCGQASWFVAARAVAGIMFASLIALSLKFDKRILPFGCILLATVPFASTLEVLHFWNLDIALMSLVYLCVGYYFHAYEAVVERTMNTWICLPMLLLLIGVKWIEQTHGIEVPVSPSRMTSFPMFLVDTLLAAFIVITFFRRFCTWGFLNYVGRNSIVFYFLCGGVPLLTGMAFRSVGLSYNGNYLLVLADFVVVVAVMSLLTYIIIRYFPFMVGRTKSEERQINRRLGK